MAVNTPTLTSSKKGYSSGRAIIDRKYEVETTAMTDTDDDVALDVATLTIPSGFYITDMTVDRRQQNPLWWQVSVKIETMPWIDNQPVPTLRAAMSSSSYDEEKEEYFVDCSPTPYRVLNSALEQFESFPTRETGNIVLQIEKNYEAYAMMAYDALAYTTNASAVTIKGTTYAANYLLFRPPIMQETVESVAGIKYTYFKMTFRLAGDDNLHRDDIDDRGYHYLDSSNVPQPITLSNQTMTPPNSPYPLDGHGHQKPHASDTPAYFEFLPYDSVEWGLSFA